MSDVLPNIPVEGLPQAGPVTDGDVLVTLQEGRVKRLPTLNLSSYILADPRLRDVVLSAAQPDLARVLDAANRAKTSEDDAAASALAAALARRSANLSEDAARLAGEKAALAATDAEQSALRAGAAETAALAQEPFFNTAIEGRDATATGESFRVYGTGNSSIDIYENMGPTVAPELRAQYPNVVFVEETRSGLDEEVVTRTALIHSQPGTGIIQLTNGYGIRLGDFSPAGYSGNASGLSGIPGSVISYGDDTGTGQIVVTNGYGIRAGVASIRANLADALSGIPDTIFSYAEGEGGIVVTNGYGVVTNAGASGGGSITPPASVTPIVGPDLFAIKGREMAVYLANIQPERRDDRTALLSLGNNVRGKPAFARSSTEMVSFDAAQFYAPTTELVVRRTIGLENPIIYRRAMLRQHSAPTALSGTVRILLIGDSINWLGMAEEIRLILADQYPSVTPIFLGTYHTSLDGRSSPDNVSGPFGEARGGSAWEDLIYRKGASADQQPVPVGQEAAYIAGTLGNRLNYNPFLIESSGSNSFSGYAFSMQWWLDTYGPLTPAPYTNGRVEVPDVVLINHGTNTISPLVNDPEAAAARCREGRRIVTESIRAACPHAAIGCWMSVPLRKTPADERWPATAAVLADLVDWAENEAAADGNMWMVNAHMHQSTELAVDLGNGSPDPVTGVLSAPVADELHPGGIYYTQSTGRSQLALASASFIASIVAGV